MSSKNPFKVIVIGGGVAGMTLAKMLEKFELDYILLEAHEAIDAPMGAAIGLMPNGSFIMDQLGCYEAIKAAARDGELEDSHIRDGNGKSLMSLKHMMYHEEKRHGYPMLFFNRQWFLKVLYDQLKHKDRIHLRSRVDHIEPIEGGIQVTTKDHRSYKGDILIGADGIHSSVRQEMRRIADANDPGYFEPGEEDNVPCFYQCSYGIAQHVDNWPGGEQCFTAGRRKSFLVVSGPGGRVYWFLFVKLPVVKYGKQIPRYSKEDEALFNKEHENLKIKEDLTFGQVCAKRLTSTLTPLHEIVYKKWFFGRIILIGDSAHKPNPIGGMGANAAIETAAEFLNEILDMKAERRDRLEDLSPGEIKKIFERVQHARFERASFTISTSHDLQALIAYENPLLTTLAVRLLIPLAGEHNFFRDLSKRIVGASRLRHLDRPSRPRALPYDHELPTKPLGALPSRVAWGLYSFGMLSLLYIASSAINESHDELRSWGEFAAQNKFWHNTAAAKDSLKGPTSLLLFPVLDSVLAPRPQLIYSLIHMLSPLLIYTIEGYRIGRHGTILSLPIIFLIGMQVQGISKISPLYALLSAFQSEQNPVDRAVRIDVARSLIPALVLSVIVPTTLPIAPTPNQSNWQDWIQVSPPLFSALTAIFSSELWRRRRRPKGDEQSDKHPEWYSTDDVPILKSIYHLAFVAQATVHLTTLAYMCFHPELSFFKTFSMLANPLKHDRNSATLFEIVFTSLKYDLVLTIVAIASHNLYSVWELRRQGYISSSRATRAAVAVVLGQVFFGSGATWAGLWSWREDVISGLSVSHEGKSSR